MARAGAPLVAARAEGAVLGREAERHRLAAAIEDPAIRLVVIRGEAGAGKTALAREAIAAVQVSPGGALVALGKHAEGPAGASAAAAGQAFAALLGQALDQLHDPEAGLASLRAALGASAPVLAALDPAFGSLEDRAAGAPVTSEAAGERLAHAAACFLRWASGLGLPILLVLDDWGRARGQAARLYERLAQEGDLPGLTLIATERSAEPAALVSPALEPGLLLDLAPLSREALHGIAAAHLGGDAVTAAAVLALLPGALTPLALIQTLEGLADAGALVRGQGDRGRGGWTLDRTAAAAALGQDVAEILLRRILAAAPDQRRLLEVAAVFGDAADRGPLEAVADLGAGFDTALAALVEEGLLEVAPLHQGGRVRFRHDTIRAAALAGLDPARRAADAGLWAEQLRRAGAVQGAEREAMLRLRLEAGLQGAEPAAWAPLFVAGAAAARATGLAALARAFADAALRLEERARAETYPAAREAGLAAVQDGDLAAGAELAAVMEARARGEAEQLEAAETAVFVARLSGDPARAFDLGRAAVARLGLSLPARGSLPAALAAVVVMRLTPDTPAKSPPRGASAHRLLNTLGAIAFERDPGIAAIMAARSAIHPALRGGAFAAALRCMLSCLMGDWAGADRWGRTAFDRLDRDEPLRAAAMQLSLQFGLGLTIDAGHHFEEAERLQALALAEGDLGVAAYANRDRALASMRMPITLARHRRILAECKANAARFQDQATEPLIDALAQLSANLAEGGPEPWRLVGDLFDSPRFEREAGPGLQQVAMAAMTFEVLLANAYGAWETTLSVWRRMGTRFDSLRHHPVTVIWAFHCGLARARLGMPLAKWEMAIVDRCARFNPVSYSHRSLALRAEVLLAKRKVGAAMQAYEAAVVAAAQSGFLMEQAVVAVAAQAAAKQAARPDLEHRFAAAEQTAWRALGATAMLKGEGEFVPTQLQEGPPSEALAKEGADRASRAKTRLLAGAAHELRTPMQGIQGLLDLAADDPATLDVARLREAFGSLSAVVDDLTELGAVEAERIALVDAPFVPLRLAQTELDLAATFPNARPFRLEAHGDVTTPAQGDAGRIAQILRNLLTNALRYGEGETTLVLTATDTDLTFDVLDHGPGLTAADQTRLFQPFVRGDAAARAEGTGLGLALSRRLAQRMGGDLTGDNRLDAPGAVFRLTVPLRPATAEPHEALRSFSGARVLLAEDTDLSRDTLAQLLTRQGHTVTAVPDGQAALDAARKAREKGKPFDLLILDVRMPRLDGPAALAQLRAEGHATPALILTASIDGPLARRLADQDPVRLVRKPLTAAQLSQIAADFAAPTTIDTVLGPDAPAARAQVAAALRQRAAEVLAWPTTGLAAARDAAHAAAGLAAQFGLPAEEAAFAAAEAAAASGDPAALTTACEHLRPLS
ncbi:response regulator [Caulobacter sp. SLTY]|uniref:ATP-binding protein n=1 Tax=Caulobacter sp. SLTY TaxID=2683262 RepID=UPI0014135088|nr:ATP-binding protein [Caulobacter sp. SLTY]NBB17584.1 response regulator [Caulobacter sp. SLTY]